MTHSPLEHIHIFRRGIDNEGEYNICECGYIVREDKATHSPLSEEELRDKLWEVFESRDKTDVDHMLINVMDKLVPFITAQKEAWLIEELEKLPVDIHSRHATRRYFCIPRRVVRSRINELKKRGE